MNTILNWFNNLLIITLMTFLYVGVIVGMATVIWFLFGAI